MLAVRLGRKKNADGAMSLSIYDLDESARIASISFAVEHGAGIVLLRLVIEDQDNLPVGVKCGVIVIAELRGRDAVTREHHRSQDVGFKGRAAEEIDVVFGASPAETAHEGESALARI